MYFADIIRISSTPEFLREPTGVEYLKAELDRRAKHIEKRLRLLALELEKADSGYNLLESPPLRVQSYKLESSRLDCIVFVSKHGKKCWIIDPATSKPKMVFWSEGDRYVPGIWESVIEECFPSNRDNERAIIKRLAPKAPIFLNKNQIYTDGRRLFDNNSIEYALQMFKVKVFEDLTSFTRKESCEGIIKKNEDKFLNPINRGRWAQEI